MKSLARGLLALSRPLPRGYWPLMRLARWLDPSLADHPIKVPAAPGVTIRADLGQSVYVQLFRHGHISHQAGLDDLFAKLVRPGDTAFDVGANIGYTAAVLATVVGARGAVVAVEPSPVTFRLLSRTLDAVSNVHLVNKGLSSTAGHLSFYVPKALDIASFTPIDGAEQIEVAVSRGDQVSAQFGHPHFMKVDVEGHEKQVFEGFSTTLAREDRPIVVFEALRDEDLQASMQTLSDASSNGYRFYRVAHDGSLHEPDQAGTSDFLAMPLWALDRLP